MFELDNDFNNIIIERLKSHSLYDESSKKSDYQNYTLNHKQAVIAMYMELCDRINPDGQITVPSSIVYHDTDKLVTYALLPKAEASAIHKRLAPHHMGNQRSPADIIDTVMDYESARFTKPDKPENAWGTVCSKYPDYKGLVLPYVTALGLTEEHQTFNFFKWSTNKLTRTIMAYQIADKIDEMYELIVRRGAEEATEKAYAVGGILT